MALGIGALAAAGVGVLTVSLLGGNGQERICDRVVSPADGPRAVQRLVRSLRPGQTGCLAAGTYEEDVTIRRGGSGEDGRVTLRSKPGARAVLVGRLVVADSANDASSTAAPRRCRARP
jgi:hypothetical protein